MNIVIRISPLQKISTNLSFCMQLDIYYISNISRAHQNLIAGKKVMPEKPTFNHQKRWGSLTTVRMGCEALSSSPSLQTYQHKKIQKHFKIRKYIENHKNTLKFIDINRSRNAMITYGEIEKNRCFKMS